MVVSENPSEATERGELGFDDVVNSVQKLSYSYNTVIIQAAKYPLACSGFTKNRLLLQNIVKSSRRGTLYTIN